MTDTENVEYRTKSKDKQVRDFWLEIRNFGELTIPWKVNYDFSQNNRHGPDFRLAVGIPDQSG